MPLMDTELHLPWDNNALEKLLLKIIQTGETTKVDFKRQLNISSAEHHAELVKDISAMANTYDYSYRNHGFLVLGITGNALTYTTFDLAVDPLQARIDELLKTYVEPFIATHVRVFGSGAAAWGVIVIPPTRTAPHVFVKDLHKRNRGDIYVRRGTTTDKALPSDYVRFFRLHLDEHTYELRQRLDEVEQEVVLLKRQPVLKTPPQPGQAAPIVGVAPSADPALEPESKSATANADDLLTVIERTLTHEQDPLTTGLIAEAQKLQKFLASQDIPWGLTQAEKTVSKQLLDQIEERSATFWCALGTIGYKDEKGRYDETIIRALTCLAHAPDAPSGVAFSDWGTYIRYLPLLVSMYILFITCAAKKRYSLLKSIKSLSLSRRSRYEEPIPISYLLFHARSAEPIYQTQNPDYPNQTWCDAVGTYVEQIIQRRMIIDDPLLDKREAFFIGEFLLSLTPLDVVDPETKAASIGHPAAGLYLYFNEADPILKRFLRKDGKGVAAVFERSFKDILVDFDQTAAKLISGRCFGHGFVAGSAAIVYPQQVGNK
jgi:hypothetical protein